MATVATADSRRPPRDTVRPASFGEHVIVPTALAEGGDHHCLVKDYRSIRLAVASYRERHRGVALGRPRHIARPSTPQAATTRSRAVAPSRVLGGMGIRVDESVGLAVVPCLSQPARALWRQPARAPSTPPTSSRNFRRFILRRWVTIGMV